MFIDTFTSREDLLNAVYAEGAAIDFFMARNIDPELVSTDAIREILTAFIEAGDECRAA